MRLLLAVGVAAMAAACASVPQGPRATTPLTSVDTAYYEVPGNTRAQWAVMLQRAARAAGIPGGAPSYTVGHVMETMSSTRTTPTGCQVDRFDVQLRLGHVMPRLSPRSAPTNDDKAAWEAFVARLWERAHAREAAGAQLADSLRRDLKMVRAPDCQEVIRLITEGLDRFPAQYAAMMRRAEADGTQVEVP